MMLNTLSRLVRGARFLPAGDAAVAAALAAVPGIIEGFPAVSGGDDARVVIPIAYGNTLRTPVERLLRSALDEALVDLPAPAGDELERRVREDALTNSLRRAMVDASSISPSAVAVPVLEAARISAGFFTEPSPMLAETVGKVRLLPIPRQGAVLARVASAMRARFVSACLGAAGEGVEIPALAGAVSSSQLVALFGRGTLDVEPRLDLVGAVMGASTPPALLDAAGKALVATLKRVGERRKAGKSTPEDSVLVLRFFSPAVLADGPETIARALALDPDVVALVMPSLARWIDAKELVAAGIDKTLAKQLMGADTGLAVASAMGELLSELRRWDVLSLACAAVRPVEANARTLPSGRVQSIDATIVAAGLGRQRADGGDGPGFPVEVARAWARVSAGFVGTLATDDLHAGYAVFDDPVQGLRFARALRSRPGEGLAPAAIGIAHGKVMGGSDGAGLRIGGPAVEAARRLIAQVGIAKRPGGMHAAAGLALVDGALAGNGIAIDAAAAKMLSAAAPARKGKKQNPAGLELEAVWDSEDGVIAMTRVPGLDGVVEALCMTTADWAALVADDAPPPKPGVRRGAERLPDRPAPPDPAPGPRAPEPEIAAEAPPDDSDPFADEGEAVFADEEPSGSQRPVRRSPPVSPPASGDGDPFATADEPDETDVLAAALAAAASAPPPAEPAPPADEPAPPVTAPPTPVAPTIESGTAKSGFEFEVEEDEDDEDEPTPPPPRRRAPEPPAPTAPASSPRTAHPPPAAPSATSAQPPRAPEPAPAADPLADMAAALLAQATDDDGGGSADGFAMSTPDSAPPSDGFAMSTPDPAPPSDGFAMSTPDPDPPAREFAPPPEEEPASDGFAMTAPEDESPSDAFGGVAQTPDPFAASADPFGAAMIDDSAPSGFSVIEAAEPAPPPRTAERAPPARERPPLESVPAPPPAADAARGRADLTVDFDYLLKGYACYFERTSAVFGRPYGTRMIDRHTYSYGGDAERAYREFLQDKIKEGFVPQADLTGDLPRGVTLMPLDVEKLSRQWRNLT